jgi:hypothetical protein
LLDLLVQLRRIPRETHLLTLLELLRFLGQFERRHTFWRNNAIGRCFRLDRRAVNLQRVVRERVQLQIGKRSRVAQWLIRFGYKHFKTLQIQVPT